MRPSRYWQRSLRTRECPVSSLLWCHGQRSDRGMLGEYGNVLCPLILYLQHEAPHGGIPTEGEHSSMEEDTPSATEHGRRRHVMGIFEEWFKERYMFEEFIEHHLNNFKALR
jgi:hypothetical protein